MEEMGRGGVVRLFFFFLLCCFYLNIEFLPYASHRARCFSHLQASNLEKLRKEPLPKLTKSRHILGD